LGVAYDESQGAEENRSSAVVASVPFGTYRFLNHHEPGFATLTAPTTTMIGKKKITGKIPITTNPIYSLPRI
jgi:hypothetical protein